MRIASIDILKVLMSLFVILLHLKFLSNSAPYTSYVLVNGLFRVAVPVFLIITGYYFCTIDTISKLMSWFKRLIILYLIWMMVYLPFWINTEAVNRNLLAIFFGYHHLWYFPGLIMGGALLYACRRIKTKVILSISVLIYLTGYTLQQIGNLHLLDGFIDKLLNFNPTYRNFLFDCFPLLSIGYLSARTGVIERLTSIKMWTLIAISAVIAESTIYYFILPTGEDVDIMLSLPATATLIFFTASRMVFNISIKSMPNYSTALFLIHPLFIEFHTIFYLNLEMTAFVLSLTSVTSIFLVLLNRRARIFL